MKERGNSSNLFIFVSQIMRKHLFRLKRIRHPRIRPLLLATAFIALTSCGGGEKPEDIISEEEKAAPTIEESRFNAQNVFNSLPDRKVVMKLIEENRIEYNPDLLNNPKSVNVYATEFQKAINLGIYGSDLSIASSFNQTQESMVFLRCVNVLAQSLGVSREF
jgi:hypothetical protein